VIRLILYPAFSASIRHRSSSFSNAFSSVSSVLLRKYRLISASQLICGVGSRGWLGQSGGLRRGRTW
jgi:hypothetical protein